MRSSAPVVPISRRAVSVGVVSAVLVVVVPAVPVAVVQGQAFKGRQFAAEVILWAVRWYLMFPISYRDLELMLQDRGVSVDHTTLFRWIQAHAAELKKRIRPHLRPTNGSWRVDETGSVAKFAFAMNMQHIRH
jgi:hypothetical protein